MAYQAQTIETTAQATAAERGYVLNPWVLHGKELLRLTSEIGMALTWSQYHFWTNQRPSSYRKSFELAAEITTRKNILAMAAEGLKLVERCEALAKTK